MLTSVANEEELDKEWINLIVQAINLGISVEEIRNFLSNPTRPL